MRNKTTDIFKWLFVVTWLGLVAAIVYYFGSMAVKAFVTSSLTTINIVSSVFALLIGVPMLMTGTFASTAPEKKEGLWLVSLLTFAYPFVYVAGLVGSYVYSADASAEGAEMARYFALSSIAYLLALLPTITVISLLFNALGIIFGGFALMLKRLQKRQ